MLGCWWCGASFIQQNNAQSDIIPSDGVFLDYSIGYSAILNFSCSESFITPSPTTNPDRDNFHYSFPKIVYTDEQIGFAVSKTFYQGNGNSSRDLGWFINIY